MSDISFFFHGTDFKCSKLNDGGRGIRRLVCLSERVEDLIAEFDRRILLGANDESEADSMDSTDPLWVWITIGGLWTQTFPGKMHNIGLTRCLSCGALMSGSFYSQESKRRSLLIRSAR